MLLRTMLATLLLLALGFASDSQAGSRPQCKDQWRGTNYSYDFRESYPDYQSRLKRSECEKEWAILVYMAADNDLFPYALWDLYEMEAAFQGPNQAGSSLKTDLVVQIDGTSPDDLRRLHIFSGPVAYQERSKEFFQNLNLDSVKSPVVARLRENDGKSEQQRLEDFLLWAKEAYPAKHTMVIVWGHGQGWRAYPTETPAQTRFFNEAQLFRFPALETPADPQFGGIAFSKSSNSWLDIPALSSVLEKFRMANGGKPIDVYASDACLMQMLEVSYEIGASARFVVGSTQVQNFLGLPYRRLMYELNTGRFNGERSENRGNVDGQDEPYLLAKMIPQLVKQSLNPRGKGLQSTQGRESYRFITSSALTSQEFARVLLPQISKLNLALKRYLKEDSLRTMDLQYIMQNVPSFEGSAQDFGIFLGALDMLLTQERIRQGGEFTRAASDLRETIIQAKAALDRTILAHAYGSAYGVDELSRTIGYIPRAVSLWLPVSAQEYRKRKSEFMASRLYRESHWYEWLDLVYPL